MNVYNRPSQNLYQKLATTIELYIQMCSKHPNVLSLMFLQLPATVSIYQCCYIYVSTAIIEPYISLQQLPTEQFSPMCSNHPLHYLYRCLATTIELYMIMCSNCPLNYLYLCVLTTHYKSIGMCRVSVLKCGKTSQ